MTRSLLTPRRFLLIACFLVLGCGGNQGGGTIDRAARDQAALAEIGELYRLYSLSKNKPPLKLEDLNSLKNAGPLGFQAVKAGLVVVQFGATMPDLTDGPASVASDEVLAYEKKVPESGGDVLMLDRTVKTLTPENFKAAKLASKK